MQWIGYSLTSSTTVTTHTADFARQRKQHTTACNSHKPCKTRITEMSFNKNGCIINDSSTELAEHILLKVLLLQRTQQNYLILCHSFYLSISRTCWTAADKFSYFKKRHTHTHSSKHKGRETK